MKIIQIILVFFLIGISLSILPLYSFQLSFLKAVNEQYHKSNVVLSPLSAYQALSFVSNGARGETQQNLVKVLGKNNQIEINRHNQKILESVMSETNLKIANAIFTTFTPNESFLQIAKKFKAYSDKLISTQQVNDWCAANTENKITQIVDSVERITMVVLNAIYFKSTWKYQFDKNRTLKEEFLNSDGSKPIVEMMNQRTNFLFAETDDYQAIQLPYKDSKISALVILPSESFEINSVISMLTDEKLSILINSMEMKRIDLKLPKFEIEFETVLNKPLSEMGLTTAFDPSKADFSNITDHVKLFIELIIQKAYIKVDEEGTEAAAVTAIMTRSASSHRNMHINRPFLFFLMNNDFNQIVFATKIEHLK